MRFKKNMHDGHRQRLMDRYLAEGLNNFEDHQVLELVLFFSIPRKDTNDIAHMLLEKFGSLTAVFEADPEELMSVPGVGKQTAVMLGFLVNLQKRYSMDIRKNKPVIKTISEAGEFFVKIFTGDKVEKLYIACLDMGFRIINVAKIAEGTINEVPLYPRKIAEVALKNNASKIIIAHNHPGGLTKPSKDDIILTQNCIKLLHQLDIRLIDHIIVSKTNYLSLAAAKYVAFDKIGAELAHAAQYD